MGVTTPNQTIAELLAEFRLGNTESHEGGESVTIDDDTERLIKACEIMAEGLAESAKVTYGTEWIAHDLEEYKSNHEIICRYYFGAQAKARDALTAAEKILKGPE